MRFPRFHLFRLRLGLWPALFALFVQATLPNLIGAEIGLLGGGEASISYLCTADTHVDYGAPGETGHHHRHDGDANLCPICLALLSSSAFSTPASLAVPLPSATVIYRVAKFDPHAPDLLAQTFYRSRAPPIG